MPTSASWAAGPHSLPTSSCPGWACRPDARAAAFDAIACGLVLNFVPDPAAALIEMKRALRPGGMVGAYVWDYSDGMRMLRIFFDAAIALDPVARERDEGER